MNILVTGGLGLIGHNVVGLLERDHLCIIIDNRTNYGKIPQDELDYLMNERLDRIATRDIWVRDITDREAVSTVMTAVQPEVVIHLASFPRQPVVNANPQWGAQVMIEGLLNLLEHAVQTGVRRFVYVSSSMVYGEFQDDVREDSECRPQGQYGIMKLAGEWLVRDYTRKHGMEHVILRPSAVYGPLDVADRVISKFLITAMQDGTLYVNGEHETLDFTYVTDAALGIVNAALLPQAVNRTFNITKSHSQTILSAAQLAVHLAGSGKIVVRERHQDYPSRGSLNIDAAKKYLAFDPRVDIEQGFKIYHDWLANSVFWSPKTIRRSA
jgi:nucleoside-diphosphate-sugar epimerase|nr:NAD-dependent epimerase/dehydratase family protein [Oxalobacteraceae bacterium]